MIRTIFFQRSLFAIRLAVFGLLMSAAATAVPVLTYNTGAGVSGNGSVDPHWTLVSSSDSAITSATSTGVTSHTTVHNNWMQDTASSGSHWVTATGAAIVSPSIGIDFSFLGGLARFRTEVQVLVEGFQWSSS